MITKEFVDYIKNSLAVGKTKDEIKATLRQQSNWNEADIEEAFSEIIPENIIVPEPINNTSNKKWIIILCATIAFFVITIFLFINTASSGVNSATGQIQLDRDYKLGSVGQQQTILPKDSIVQVKKEYFLPQLLLPGPMSGMKLFDTHPPFYTEIGTGKYFTGKNIKEVVPFKGTLKQGAFADSLSLGYIYNQMIVFGFIIALIIFFIFIVRKIKFKKNTIIQQANKRKKYPYYIPIVLIILLLSYVPPISYATMFLGLPLRLAIQPIENKSESTFLKDFQAEKAMFPILPEFKYDKNGESVQLSPEELATVKAKNEEQMKKIIAYRESKRPSKSLAFIALPYTLSTRYPGQITIIIIAILYYFFILRRKKI